MRRRTCCVLATSALLGAWVGAADVSAQENTQENTEYGATARISRPIPSGSDLDPTAAATTIETEDRTRPQESLSELLRESPGARALSLGALGSFSILSLRGSGAEHTRVVFDMLPLGREGEAFDLSTIPVATLDSVEVYRGGAPVLLGGGAIGGVLRLVPRQEQDLHGAVGVGYGSFGTRAARIVGGTGERPGPTSFTAAAGIDGTDGNYPYEEDLTPLTPGDERQAQRQNGAVDRGYGLGHLRTDVGGGTLSIVGFGFGRAGGVPGPAVQPTRNTRRSAARYGGMVGFHRPSSNDSPLTLGLSAGAMYERNQFADRYAEIGLGRQAADDGVLSANARAGAELRLAKWVSAALVVGYGYERFDPEDALSQIEIGTSQRHAASLAGESIFRAHLGQARIEVRPSARIEVNHARLEEIRTMSSGTVSDATTVVPTFRLGIVAEPTPGLAFVGSVTTGARVPTLTELFGDRGFLIGDTSLLPERSVGGDLGAVLRGRWGPIAGQAEVRGFGLRIEDLIRYRRTSQYQAVPQNIAVARIVGVEGGLRMKLGKHVGIAGAVTVLSATDLRGLGGDRDLPLRPNALAYVRPSIGFGPWGAVEALDAFVDVTHVGDAYADPANLVAAPGRTRVGAGVGIGLVAGRVRFDAVLEDVFDARGQDVLGFPLPGRAFFVELTLATGAR